VVPAAELAESLGQPPHRERLHLPQKGNHPVTPELDPATCAELETAVRQIAAESRDAVPTSWTDYAVMRDRGVVSPRIIARLAGLLKNYRYTMQRSDDLNFKPGSVVLGATAGPAFPGPERLTVRIQRGMSRASETRVACHETAHVILGHTGLTMETSIDALMKRLETQKEDPAEEIAAELAAGAFCRVARIGTGLFSPQFIWQRKHGASVPEDETQAGLLGARLLWAATRPALTEVAA
jgi:hypothetical protein